LGLGRVPHAVASGEELVDHFNFLLFLPLGTQRKTSRTLDFFFFDSFDLLSGLVESHAKLLQAGGDFV
jgi:hypothetical protein